jgi:peptidylprolyl isomerase
MTAVETGDRVNISYVGKFEDGNVFDRSPDDRPLSFVAGEESEVIDGLSLGVLGMAEGEQKTITVPPDQGYGDRRNDLEYRVSREMIPGEVKVGDPLRAETEGGSVVVWLVGLDDTHATVDANHPLAGRTLVFDIEILSIEKSE